MKLQLSTIEKQKRLKKTAEELDKEREVELLGEAHSVINVAYSHLKGSAEPRMVESKQVLALLVYCVRLERRIEELEIADHIRRDLR